MIHQLMNQFAMFFDTFLFLIAPVFFVVGMLMAYFGLAINRILVWLVGFVWGGLIGAALGILIGGKLGAFLGFFILGIIFGNVFLEIIVTIPKIIGFFAAYLPMLLLLRPEGVFHVIPLGIGLAGGWVGGFLERTFVIITSSLTGAWMVTTSCLCLYGYFDRAFNGNIFSVFEKYSFIAVIIYCAVFVTGILKQYGLVDILSWANKYVFSFSRANPVECLKPNSFEVFISYCLEKKNFASISKKFAWFHAIFAWIFILASFVTAVSLILVLNNMGFSSGFESVRGWIFIKAVLSFFLFIYFSVAFYQCVRIFSNKSVPEWGVVVIFRFGLILSFLWILASIVPMSQGMFDYDSLLVIFIIVPVIFQYKEDNILSFSSSFNQ